MKGYFRPTNHSLFAKSNDVQIDVSFWILLISSLEKSWENASSNCFPSRK